MPQAASTNSRRRVLILAALVALLAVVAVQYADRATAARNSKVIGKTKKTPRPLCPNKSDPGRCQATGTVTGFGVEADGKRGLYKVRADGHIVAWSVELSKPTRSQRSFFEESFEDEKFGTDPHAGIAILKKKGKRGSRYTLGKKSPVVNLSGSLGEKPIFTLDNPLRVKKGTVVALTMPTWAPLFNSEVSASKNAWKASRKTGDCGRDSVTTAKPQLRKGSTRTYGCKLAGERLLYWAYFVPLEKKG